MCGIAGFVESATVNPLTADGRRDLIHRMCDVIRHRGPDDEGILVEDGAALGMRRLSIIDLSTGHQPIHNEDRTVWVVFNGEIYNFRALRSELEAAGHRFYTATDTEVIVHAYEQWGAGAIARLRGMFGLAIWDRRSRSLLVADGSASSRCTTALSAAGCHSDPKSSRSCGAPDLPRELMSGARSLPVLPVYAEGRFHLHACQEAPAGTPAHLARRRIKIEPYWELPPRNRSWIGSRRGCPTPRGAHRRRSVASDERRPLGAFLSVASIRVWSWG